MEGEVVLDGLPFVLVDLHGKLLGAAIVAAIGGAVLFFKIADFFGEFLAFRSPGNEDGMGGAVDEAETFGSGFELVGFCPVVGAFLWVKASFAGDEVGFVPVVRFRASLPDRMLEVGTDGCGGEEVGVAEGGEDVAAGDRGVGLDVGESVGERVVGGLEEIDLTFGFLEFAVTVAASCGLSEGVETTLGAIDDGKADIDPGFDELGGHEDDCFSLFPQALGLGKDEHDVARAHPGGEMEGVGVRAELFVEGLRGLGGVENEEAAFGRMVAKVVDEGLVIKGTEVVTLDAFEGLEESGLVLDDGGDFLRGNADFEVVACFEGWLGCGAENGGGVEVVDEAAEGAKDGMQEGGRKGLDFIENDDAAGDAMEFAAAAGAVGVERFEELNVGGDDEGRVPVLCGQAVFGGFLVRLEFGVVL